MLIYIAQKFFIYNFAARFYNFVADKFSDTPLDPPLNQ